MDNPRAGTFCLLLAIGLGVWSVVNSLDQGRKRLTLHDPSSAAPPPPADAVSEPRDTPEAAHSIIETLDPAHLAEGRIVDPRGRPVANARVRCGDIKTRSDHRGLFKLPRGSEKIEISHQDFFPATLESLSGPRREVPASQESADTEEDIILIPGCRLSGILYDSLYSPVEEARVSFETASGAYYPPVSTTSKGTWISPLLQPGLVRVLYSHGAHVPRSDSATLTEAEPRQGLEMVLHSGKPARIRVLDEKGSYLAEARVWTDRPVHTGAGDSIASYLGQTDDLGLLQCAIPEPAPGKIRVRYTGYREKTVDIPPMDESSGTRDLEIRLEQGLLLIAHAVDKVSGLPIRPDSVEVEIETDGDFLPAGNVTVQHHSLDDGKIRIGLPGMAGNYRLRVNGEGDRYGLSEIIRFDGKKSPSPFLVRLTPSRSRFQGFVTFDQETVPRALVELLSAVGTWSGHTTIYGVRVARPTRAMMSTYTDSSGSFHFRQFEPGTYRIRVSHPHHATYQGAPVELPLADSARRFPLRLRNGATLEGRVLSPQAEGIGGIPVVLSSSMCSPRSVLTDPRGRYSFTALPAADDIRIEMGSGEEDTPGINIEWAGRNGARSAAIGNISITAGERLTIDLIAAGGEENGGLRGSITLDGQPLATSLVLVSLPEQGRSPVFFSAGNGGFALSPLPPGKYRLNGQGFPFARELAITPGEIAELAVSLKSLSYDLEIASNSTGESLGIPCRITAEMTTATAGQREQAPWTKRTLVATSGRLLLEGLLPVTYRLLLEAENHVPATVRINPGKGRSGRATLKRGKKTRLNLKKPSGEIFAGEVAVLISDHSGRTVHNRKHQVDGVLELPVLPPGSYRIQVRTRKRPYEFSLNIEAN